MFVLNDNNQTNGGGWRGKGEGGGQRHSATYIIQCTELLTCQFHKPTNQQTNKQTNKQYKKYMEKVLGSVANIHQRLLTIALMRNSNIILQ